MLDLVIILGSMAYASYRAQKEHTAKQAAARQSALETGASALPSAESAVTTAVRNTVTQPVEYQAAYRLDAQRNLRLSGVAAGASALAIIYAPVGVVALSLLAYLSLPLYKSAYTSLVIERRARSSAVESICWISGQASGLYLLTSVSAVVYFYSFKLARKTEDNSRKKLADAFARTPRKVWVLQDGQEIEVSFDALQCGDVVVLQAGEFIPIDGIVLHGAASVDQCTLTGEAYPVEKTVGDRVFASTLLLAGKIQVVAEQTGMATQTASIQQLLNRTTDFKMTVESKAVQFSDSLAGPTLMAGGVATLALGPLTGSALVACNMADTNRLTSPLGVLNYIEISLDQGVLIKDGRCLELLGGIDTVVFDKTGTLTLEEPHIDAIHSFADYSPNALLRFAAAAEQKNTHPIARAIMASARARMITLPTLDEARVELGLGLRVELEHQVIHVGSARFMAASGIALADNDRLAELRRNVAEHGASLVYVAVDNKVEGAIELRSTIRPEAQRVLKQLRARGLQVAIISGDHEAPTRSLAGHLGVEHYYSGVLPSEKASILEELRARGHSVCFIGDGVNDAVALKTANVSISIHGASDTALDTAGVVLLDGTLNQLGALFELSDELRKTEKLDYYATSIPAVAGAGGVLFFGFGLSAALMLYLVSIGGALGTAMWPKYVHRRNIKLGK